MIRRSLKSEAGYSLVEVMVSILILSIAIIPMVGMFDMGLDSATRGSNYDRARALAKKQMEGMQSLSYANVKLSFPSTGSCTFSGSGLCATSNLTDSDPEFSNFRYDVNKQFVSLNGAGTAYQNESQDEGVMQITVEVGWGGANFDDNIYTTTSIKAK